MSYGEPGAAHAREPKIVGPCQRSDCKVTRRVLHIDREDAIERANKVEAERDAHICQFIGWLSGDIPELHAVEVTRLADSYERFCAARKQGGAS